MTASLTNFLPTGTVYLVGAGPGDPELLTRKALRLLGEADVIVHDYLVAPAIMALANPAAEKIFVGKKGGGFCCPQRDIESILIRLAREKRTIVRLKGGDPSSSVAAAKRPKRSSKPVSPSKSSPASPPRSPPPPTLACRSPTAPTRPLSFFSRDTKIPNKPDAAIHWEDYGKLGATLCLYMGMKNLETITRRLQAGGTHRRPCPGRAIRHNR